MPAPYHHPVRFDANRRERCMFCRRICPTSATRARSGWAAKGEDLRIDCGERGRIRPQRAIVALAYPCASESKAVLPSAVLYSHFDLKIFPGMIFAALKQCGFDDAERVSAAGEYHGQYPLIPSFCTTCVLEEGDHSDGGVCSSRM